MSHSEHRGERARQAAACELRAAVARKQLTLSALSAAAGIPRSTLHSKLQGHSDLTVAELVKLAIALDVPVARLVARMVEVSEGEGTGKPAQR
ncbi:helix-turn-helix domain-containing protein [Nocardioides antri]|uniref:Helix-turn-helix transcriptional regulator n=1 Tax=Nocardioides antri TaxID=2607659 RepID=A0A5B1M7N8_9ACTN|nr:helix-turn-helix transcriptional regulator [Nocardioides antri]KAA1427877.1 helix-turn-helix transcriptional regulator [Nocardioides antri]